MLYTYAIVLSVLRRGRSGYGKRKKDGILGRILPLDLLEV